MTLTADDLAKMRNHCQNWSHIGCDEALLLLDELEASRATIAKARELASIEQEDFVMMGPGFALKRLRDVREALK